MQAEVVGIAVGAAQQLQDVAKTRHLNYGLRKRVMGLADRLLKLAGEPDAVTSSTEDCLVAARKLVEASVKVRRCLVLCTAVAVQSCRRAMREFPSYSTQFSSCVLHAQAVLTNANIPIPRGKYGPKPTLQELLVEVSRRGRHVTGTDAELEGLWKDLQLAGNDGSHDGDNPQHKAAMLLDLEKLCKASSLACQTVQRKLNQGQQLLKSPPYEQQPPVLVAAPPTQVGQKNIPCT